MRIDTRLKIGLIIYLFIDDYILKGDSDNDDEITVSDALIALRIAAKLAAPVGNQLITCDVDRDGEITVGDALKILRVAAKLADADSLL